MLLISVNKDLLDKIVWPNILISHLYIKESSMIVIIPMQKRNWTSTKTRRYTEFWHHDICKMQRHILTFWHLWPARLGKIWEGNSFCHNLTCLYKQTNRELSTIYPQNPHSGSPRSRPSPPPPSWPGWACQCPWWSQLFSQSQEPCCLTFWYDLLKACSPLEGYFLSFCHFRANKHQSSLSQPKNVKNSNLWL